MTERTDAALRTAPEVEGIRTELEAALSRVSVLRIAPDTNRVATRPPTGGWSALECVEHLNITSDAFLPVLSEAMGRAPRGSARGPMRMGFLARLLLWYMEPPYRARSRTPERFAPRESKDVAEVFDGFGERQARVLALLEQAAGLRLDEVSVVSPFDSRLSYNLFAAFELFAAHQRRHAWQAERVLRALQAGQGVG